MFKENAMDLMEEVDQLAGWSEAGAGCLLPAGQSNAGFMVCGRDGRVLVCSLAAAAVYGRGASEMSGWPVDMLLLDKCDGAEGASRSRAALDLEDLSAKDGWRLFTAVRSDGGELPVAVSIRRFQVDGISLYLFRMQCLHGD